MGVSLDGKLVVAISSRALFDFEEENQVFEQGDDRAYMQLQLARLETPAKPGVAICALSTPIYFCPHICPMCARHSTQVCQQHRCTHIQRMRQMLTPTKCALLSMVMRCCSATKPSACFKRRA